MSEINKILATIPDFWRIFDWSTDYRVLFDLLIAGNRVPCLAPYTVGGRASDIWDICKGWYDDYSGFDFGARGISYTRSYPHDDHSFEAFERLCKEGDIVFLRPQLTLTAKRDKYRDACESAETILRRCMDAWCGGAEDDGLMDDIQTLGNQIRRLLHPVGESEVIEL